MIFSTLVVETDRKSTELFKFYPTGNIKETFETATNWNTYFL